MTHTDLTRRSVARAALWSAPVIATAATAPALAASCDPSTNVVTRSVALSASLSGSPFNTPSDASVTYINTGPDALPVGSVVTFKIYATYNPDNPTPTSTPSVLPSADHVSVTGAVDTSGTYPGDVYVFTYTVQLNAALAVNQSFGIDLNTANLGAAPQPSGSNYQGAQNVSALRDATDSTQSVIAGCQTITTSISVTTN